MRNRNKGAVLRETFTKERTVRRTLPKLFMCGNGEHVHQERTNRVLNGENGYSLERGWKVQCGTQYCLQRTALSSGAGKKDLQKQDIGDCEREVCMGYIRQCSAPDFPFDSVRVHGDGHI